MRYYFAAIRRYAVFDGRASRAEYWYFVLFNSLVVLGLEIVDFIIAAIFGSTILLSTLYQLAVFIPTLAVTVRRMHDVNKSGWFFLVPIYNFILLLKRGTAGENRFGADPKNSREGQQKHSVVIPAEETRSGHE